MKKKSILFIGDFPPPFGGVAVWNQRILEELKKDEHIDLITYAYKRKIFLDNKKHTNTLSDALERLTYVYFRVIKAYFSKLISFSDILRSIKHLPNIFRLIKGIEGKGNYIFYTSHTAFRALILSFLADTNHNFSFIIHVHGSGVIEYAKKRPKLVTYLLNRSDKIVVTTEYMKSICKLRGSVKDNIAIIPCGINTKEKEYCEDKKYISFCGALEEHKDPMSFVRAIPHILKEYKKSDVKFILIGKGSLEELLKNEVKKLQVEHRVIFPGQISNEEVEEIFYKSKVFVLPSKREAFGIVLIEALNNYTPCVITKVGGMPEIISTNKIGRSVDIESPEMIAKAVLEIISDEIAHKEMCIKAYEESLKYDMRLIKNMMDEEVFN